MSRQHHHLPALLGNLSRFMKTALHLKTALESEDRQIFEQEIQPYFLDDPAFHTILFVGCESYTRHYNRWYQDKDYWTLEIDPNKKRFGAKNHITDSITHVTNHFKADSLDLIYCNGVYGWGLDKRQESDQAFEGCYQVLRPGGVLMVGWNDIQDSRYHIPCPPEELESIQKFEPYVFRPRLSSRIVCAEGFKHVFDFYKKLEAERA